VHSGFRWEQGNYGSLSDSIVVDGLFCDRVFLWAGISIVIVFFPGYWRRFAYNTSGSRDYRRISSIGSHGQ